MKRKEVLQWLHVMKWTLEDSGHRGSAWLIEDVENRLDGPSALSVVDCHTYSSFILASGRRGHAMLTLAPPFEARVRAWLVGMLRAIEDEPVRRD